MAVDGDYSLYIRYEISLLLRTIRGVQRERIVRFIESLPTNPFQKGDDQDQSPEGRQIQVKVVDRYAVLFWAYHAVREVKVVDLISADA